MNNAVRQAPVYIGIDVAKATLQVHCDGTQKEINNSVKSLDKLIEQLQGIKGSHVVCEATGGYERGLVSALHTAQIPVSVVNPARVRAAAHAKGERAKNDRIDAAVLTDYGQLYQPSATPQPSATQLQLQALQQWLTQLINAQAVAKAQAEHHDDLFVKAQHEQLLNHYQAQIKQVDAKLDEVMAQDQDFAQRVETLDEIDGVGRRTAVAILAHMPELGTLNRGQTAALAGLAPWTRESGTYKGYTFIGGGRPEIRAALYMAALSAIRYNPVLRDLYQHLTAKGKPFKVAITAVMRRLVIYMNCCLKPMQAKTQPVHSPQPQVSQTIKIDPIAPKAEKKKNLTCKN